MKACEGCKFYLSARGSPACAYDVAKERNCKLQRKKINLQKFLGNIKEALNKKG